MSKKVTEGRLVLDGYGRFHIQPSLEDADGISDDQIFGEIPDGTRVRVTVETLEEPKNKT